MIDSLERLRESFARILEHIEREKSEAEKQDLKAITAYWHGMQTAYEQASRSMESEIEYMKEIGG